MKFHMTTDRLHPNHRHVEFDLDSALSLFTAFIKPGIFSFDVCIKDLLGFNSPGYKVVESELFCID